MQTFRIVVFGDIHGSWDGFDLPYYRAKKPDLVLFTGDVGGSARIQPILQDLLAICPNTFGILGNHDGAHMAHVIAEALGQDTLARTFAKAHGERVRGLRALLGQGDVGFARRDLPALQASVIGVRPHSTGGDRHHFPDTLTEVYGVSDPAARHRANVADAPPGDLILIGHNGPLGLGGDPTDPFGIDFKAGGGDLGDPDYADALDAASAAGRRVLFAVGGHMHDALHRRSAHLGRRRTFGLRRGIPVINACRIPRIDHTGRRSLHRHVEILVDRAGGTLTVEDVAWSPHDPREIRAPIFQGPLPPTTPTHKDTP